MDHVVALTQVEGKEGGHAHVVEAERDVVASAEEKLPKPRGLVRANQPVRLQLEDHESIALAELRAPWDANEAAHGEATGEVALPLEAHERRAARHGIGREARTETRRAPRGQREMSAGRDARARALHRSDESGLGRSRIDAPDLSRPQEVEVPIQPRRAG